MSLYWHVEAATSVLRLLLAPTRRALRVLSALLTLAFIVAFYEDVLDALKIAEYVVSAYPLLILIVVSQSLVSLGYVRARGVMAIELIVLWLRFLNAPSPDTQSASQATRDRRCAKRLGYLASVIRDESLSLRNWNCVRGHLRQLASRPSDMLRTPRFYVSLALTLLLLALYTPGQPLLATVVARARRAPP